MTLPALILVGLLSQSASTPDVAQSALRAAEAAERAAEAAQRAAEAAQRAAAASSGVPLATVTAIPPGAATPSGWTGTAGLALIWLTGNSSTLTFNANAAAKRQWAEWALGFKAFGVYGLSRAADPAAPQQVTALGAGGQLRGDRKLSDFVASYLTGGLSTDHVKSVELSSFGEAGAGLTWIDVKGPDYQKVLLRTDFAARFQHDNRYQYYPTHKAIPSVNLLGPRAGVAFRYALNKEVIFIQEAEVIPSVLRDPSGRVLADSTTKLASRLSQSLTLGLAFQVNYDSAPAVGKVPTDTALTVGVEFAL